MDLIPLVDRHTALLLATAENLDSAGTASLCPGWTRGHILTHVARNADGLTRLARAALEGTGETMYASTERRDEAIDAGAGRSLPDLVEDVRSSAAELRRWLARVDPSSEVLLERTPGGPTLRAGVLAFLRIREVVYHHADLDAGFGFEDVEEDLVALFLRDEVTRLAPAARVEELWRLGRGVERGHPSGP